MVPGEMHRPYHHGAQARQILNDAEDDLKDWRLDLDDHHLGAFHQHEIVSDEKTENHHISSVGGGQQTPPRQITTASGDVVEETPTAKPQGECQNKQGSQDSDGNSVSGGAVALTC